MTEEATNPIARAPLRLAFITLTYTLVHGVSLLNRGIYWDDWVFWKQAPAVVSDAAMAMGSTWPASINRLFYYSQTGIFLNRAVTFLAMLLTALLFYDILRRLPGVSDTTAMWTAVVFGVFPAYECRIALVLVGYSLSLALFASALWILVRTVTRPTIPLRVLSAVLFLLSFKTGSLLLFFAVVPVVLLMVDPPEAATPRSAFERLLGYADQMMLPVLYWLVTRIWFVPFGRYASYNEPGSGEIGLGLSLLYALINVGVGPFGKAYRALALGMPIAGAAPAGLLALSGTRRWRLSPDARWFRHFLAGVALAVLGVLPYVIVGKIPNNYDWEMRHQLLVAFGGSLMIVAVARGLSGGTRVRRAVGASFLVLVLTASAAVHLESYLQFERDWLKQQALMEQFRHSDAVRDARFIAIDDTTMDLDRSLRSYYEFTGMLTQVYGDQRRYAALVHHIPSDREVTQLSAHQPYYKLADFAGGHPDLLVVVGRGRLDLRDNAVVLRLTLLEWTDPAAFHEAIGGALVLDAREFRESDRW